MSTDGRTLSKKSGEGSSGEALPAANGRKTGNLLYDKVAQILRDEIVEGVYPVGTLLPTEAELRERFSVSRYTIREALRELREGGFVSSRQGSGTIVERLHQPGEFVLKAETINELVAYSSDIWVEFDSVGIETVTGARAARLGIAEGEEWLVARGYVTSTSSDLPLCWGEHYINREYAEIAGLLAPHRAPVFRLIEDAMGVVIADIEQEISGSLIPAELAASLGVEPASAGIEVKRTFTTAHYKVAQITLHTHPASRFRYTTRMSRPKG